jgi:integrase
MGRKATNVIAYNDQAIRRAVKEAEGRPRGEWRVAGVDRLVLMTQPTGTGTFFVFYTGAGGRRRKLRLGEYHPERFTLREARGRALDALATINRGADPVAEADARANALTFKALAEKFLAEAPHLAATTRRNYRQYLEKAVFPAIGGLPAAEVTADHIVAICKGIEAGGAHVQSQNTKTAIGGVYRWAVRERLVKSNPCAGIGRRSPLVARTRTPTDSELATLWATISDTSSTVSQPMRLILQLAILTGQRRTEVAGARISELHGLETDAPVWVIPGDVNRRGKIIEGRTKNGREQRVPLSMQAAALFRKAVALSGGGEHVFPADLSKVKIGNEPRMQHTHGGSVTSAMRRLRAAAGVDDVSVHDMRRAVSNWLKDQGVSREVRDLVLNHKDASITEAHYSNSARMEKQVRAALQAWSDHVWSITGQSEPASNVVEMKRA